MKKCLFTIGEIIDSSGVCILLIQPLKSIHHMKNNQPIKNHSAYKKNIDIKTFIYSTLQKQSTSKNHSRFLSHNQRQQFFSAIFFFLEVFSFPFQSFLCIYYVTLKGHVFLITYQHLRWSPQKPFLDNMILL